MKKVCVILFLAFVLLTLFPILKGVPVEYLYAEDKIGDCLNIWTSEEKPCVDFIDIKWVRVLKNKDKCL